MNCDLLIPGYIKQAKIIIGRYS